LSNIHKYICISLENNYIDILQYLYNNPYSTKYWRNIARILFCKIEILHAIFMKACHNIDMSAPKLYCAKFLQWCWFISANVNIIFIKYCRIFLIFFIYSDIYLSNFWAINLIFEFPVLGSYQKKLLIKIVDRNSYFLHALYNSHD